MAPDPRTCEQLLRPLSALLALKHSAGPRSGACQSAGWPRTATSLLVELVRTDEARACDLATARTVDASVVGRQLAQLERAELINRRPDPADGRVPLLRATPAGERKSAESTSTGRRSGSAARCAAGATPTCAG